MKAKNIIDKLATARYDLKLFDFKPLKIQVELLDSLIYTLKQKRIRLKTLPISKPIQYKILRVSRRITALQQLKYLLVTQSLVEQNHIIKQKTNSYKTTYRYLARFKFYISTDLSKIKGYNLLKKLGFYNKDNNPQGCVLDHRLSIHYGLTNTIEPNILGHLANCEFLTYSDNLKKSSNSSITYEQLIKEIIDYNSQ